MAKKTKSSSNLSFGYFGTLLSPAFKPAERIDAYRAFYDIGVTAALFDAAQFWIVQLELDFRCISAQLDLKEPKTRWIAVGLAEWSMFLGNRNMHDLIADPEANKSDERYLLRWIAVRKAMEEGFTTDAKFERAHEILTSRGYDKAEPSTIESTHKKVNTQLMKNALQPQFYPTRRVGRIANSIGLDLGKG